jgi:hypothetical protein
VIATSLTVWLQPLMCCDWKKPSCKNQHVRDCNLVTCAWLQFYRSVIAKQVKVRLQKMLHAAEKKKVHKNIARVPIHKFKQKKDVKLPHHRREYFQTATNNMSRTIKIKHTDITFFYPTDPKSSQTGCCHLRDQDSVPQFCTCPALQGDQPGWGGGRFDSAASHICKWHRWTAAA